MEQVPVNIDRLGLHSYPDDIYGGVLAFVGDKSWEQFAVAFPDEFSVDRLAKELGILRDAMLEVR